MSPVGTLRDIHRFPVKSMAGERLAEAEIGSRGIVGDRLYAVRDAEKDVITGGKKLPALMRCSARFVEEPRGFVTGSDVPAVVITFPDGSDVRSDDPDVDRRLSDFVGRRVSLAPLPSPSDKGSFRMPPMTHADMRQMFGLGPGEPLPDFSMFPLAKLAELGLNATAVGTYFDAYPLHVVTTASLAELARHAPEADFDARRFRPNFVVETDGPPGLVEAAWCGGTLAFGSVTARILIPTVRCSMPTRAQPGIPDDTRVMKTVAARAERCCGVYADVAQAGRTRAGDAVTLSAPEETALSGLARSGSTRMKRLILSLAARLSPKG